MHRIIYVLWFGFLRHGKTGFGTSRKKRDRKIDLFQFARHHCPKIAHEVCHLKKVFGNSSTSYLWRRRYDEQRTLRWFLWKWRHVSHSHKIPIKHNFRQQQRALFFEADDFLTIDRRCFDDLPRWWLFCVQKWAFDNPPAQWVWNILTAWQKVISGTWIQNSVYIGNWLVIC